MLDFIRYHKRLTGTKIGCREGDCGACTVLIGDLVDGQMKYQNVTSCLTPIGNVYGKHVVSVEGLNMEDLTPVQQFMIDESGTQCGFCTVGFVMSLSGYCLSNSAPNYKDAIASIDGNICRCTGYKSIERATQKITDTLKNKDTEHTVKWLVENKFIPDYFLDIPKRMEALNPVEEKITKAILIGGGTDLYVQKHDQLVDKEVGLVAHQNSLRYITAENGICTIGGGTTVTDLLESELFSSFFSNLSDHVKLVSSSPIRNISTVAGNFVNASPIGDFTAFFLALDAKITLSENEKERTIFLKDFYKGYKDLDKSKEEILTAISFAIPSSNSQFNLEKISKRIHLDIASVNSAIAIATANNTIETIHISAGGVGPIPTYLHQTVAFLKGKAITAENIKQANEVLQSEISPISDVRGTADYKRLLLRQLFYAHFVKLFPNQIALKSLV
ncbi:MAG: FAD binding domain-containing protein [Chitinophagales bacterium]